MKKNILLILTLMLIFTSLNTYAMDNTVDIHLFYGSGCPHCAKEIAFLENIIEDYPTLNINKYETYFNESNRDLFASTMNSLDREIQGVPTSLINDEIFIGFNDQTGELILQEINFCLNNTCTNPIEETNIDEEFSHTTIALSAVILAAIVDAINPCAFAVLIILLSTILMSNNRKKVLLSGLTFTTSIFISYFFMGVGLYSAIQIGNFAHTFYIIVAVLAIFIGLFNLKDYFHYGKWFIMEVPMSWRPKLKSLLKGVTSIPGAFFIGFLVSLFLLPCTSGPYIVILGLLSEIATKNYAIFLLVIYNFVFVLPMLIITTSIYLGIASTEKLEELRQRKLEVLHLIAGLIILLLGIGMLTSIYFGWI
ncbi:hypothetical protein C0585_06205 [Candidatus Woesearchaeota archaeon]|nr:MAG: hypothetical protein C0585_06205 [Candidatus Woesearchaeota archaeon]